MNPDEIDPLSAVAATVDRHWSEHVEIVGLWLEAPQVVCAVYRRRTDPNGQLLGRHAEFSSHAADGTTAGIAADFALNMAEPPGALMARGRTDADGVTWFGFAPPSPTPTIPAEIRDRLAPSARASRPTRPTRRGPEPPAR